MATTIQPAAEQQSAPERRVSPVRSRFVFWLTIICAGIAILGFMPTYWLQISGGTFIGPPLLHIHGFLNSAWVLFLITQSWLVSKGKIRNHRDWGLAGIALATFVVVIGYTAAIISLKERLAHGDGDAARMFFMTSFMAITLFAVFTAAAIACTHRPEWHRRLMIVGSVWLVNAAAARFAFLIAVGHRPGLRPGLVALPPEAMPIIVGLLMQLILIAGMIYDKRTRGSVHPAWIVGLVVSVLLLALKMPISHTPTWLAFADWTTRIAG